MTPKYRRYLRILLLAVFAVSTFLLLRQCMDNSNGSTSYENALDIATQAVAGGTAAAPVAPSQEPVVTMPETDSGTYWYAAAIPADDKNLKYLRQIDVTALQERNPDVLAWIYAPGTKINYPVLQGEDNDYYLNHTWDGWKNSVGSIFMEYRNNPTFMDFNTILYGHNMNDGSMFADVIDFSQEQFAKSHPYIYLVLPGGILRYDVFSAYKAPVDGQTYGLSFNQEQTRVDFLNYAKENSTIQTGVAPKTTDLILTLSTCTGRGYSDRWVVHARLEMFPAEG